MKFGTFWYGNKFSAFEYCCLQSVIDHGHEITVFNTDADSLGPVPPGVQLRSASEVVDPKSLGMFLIDGKPNMSHFSDYFRYKMFGATGLAWIDADMFMLADAAIPDGQNIFALEDEGSICGAILRITANDPSLKELIRQTEARMGRDLRWGETGPKLLTRVLGQDKVFALAHRPSEFFPIHYLDFWKMFLPEYTDECVAKCKNAKTVHLWNNIVDRLGFWKNMLPPEGSFLHGLFAKYASQAGFVTTYPTSATRKLVDNWLFRQNGGDLRAEALIKQMLPSLRRTLKHRFGW